jgi:hypothetical protein
MSTGLEQLIKNNRIYSFTTEYNVIDDVDRKKQLHGLIQKLSSATTPQSNLEKFNSMLNKIEVTQTKKPFHRLNEFQKEKLVKAYVDETYDVDDKISIKYVKTIMEFIKKKDIASSNIEYDIDNFKLNTIKNIIVVDGDIQIKPKKIVKEKVVKEEKVEEVKVEEEKVEEVKVEKKYTSKAPTKKK